MPVGDGDITGSGAAAGRRGRWPPNGRDRARRPRRSGALLGALALLGVVALLGAVVGADGAVGPSGAVGPGAHARVGGGAVAGAGAAVAAADLSATFLGPDGVESAAIEAENRRPGTTAWRITGPPAAGAIAGFADENYVARGDWFGLYVTTTAPSYRVTAYRMGWYGGAGARPVWTSGPVPGTRQPACPVAAATNTVECDNWSQGLTVRVDGAWPPGDYLLELVGSGGQESYVPLTVWDPASRAAYLVVNRTMTEEGWNSWGGYDFYQGLGPCLLDSAAYPPCNRARVVSLDRPYAAGEGASDFLDNEYPLIRWMEQHGLDVTYATDITLDQHPTFAARHRAWLSLDHDETWTWTELQAARHAAAAGTNVAFFSGAAIVRHARMQASPLGPARQVVDYRDAAEDPARLGRDPDIVTANSWAPAQTAFTGEMYSGLVLPGTPQVPLVVEDGSSWLFRGTGLRTGSAVPAAVGSDIDHVDPAVAVPADLRVLGHSPIPPGQSYTSSGTWNGVEYSDLTYYTEPRSGAGILDTGDTTFITDLEDCVPSAPACPAPLLRTMVTNILYLFGQGPAGARQPSVPNWQSVRPYGS